MRVFGVQLLQHLAHESELVGESLHFFKIVLLDVLSLFELLLVVFAAVLHSLHFSESLNSLFLKQSDGLLQMFLLLAYVHNFSFQRRDEPVSFILRVDVVVVLGLDGGKG